MEKTPKTITLITGANTGIGYELALQLLSEESNHVLLGSRSVEKGEAALVSLRSKNLPGTVEQLNIDVTSEESVKQAAREVQTKWGRLDAIVNNAGVCPTTGSLAQQMNLTLQTNTTGPAVVVEAFAPLLEKSTRTPRIVNISSQGGSITIRLDASSPYYNQGVMCYRTSKAALNMITACQAVEYGSRGWKVFAFDPGFTASNLTSMNVAANGAQPASNGAAPIVAILNGDRDEEHSGFLHADGRFPW